MANLKLNTYTAVCAILLFLFPAISFAQCMVTAQKDSTVCKLNVPIQLSATATGALGYTWAPATGLSNPAISNPIAKTDTTRQYIVTAVVPENTELVTNGDFEAGNTGFTSAYTHKANPTPFSNNLLEGQYTIKKNPSTTHQCFAACTDKTTGSGNMMIMNGSSTPNVAVWTQTITVQPNTDYAFSAWLQNVTCPPYGYNAELQFSINSTLIGNIFKSDSAICSWKQFYQVWNSGSSTSATISIVNQYTSMDGNDFALDNISFKKFCTAKDTVTITVNAINSSGNIQLCTGDSILLKGSYRKAGGTFFDTLTTSSGCDSVRTTHLQIGGFIGSTTNKVICPGDSTLLQGAYRNTAGTYYDTLISIAGCDSIITSVLQISGFTGSTISISICPNDSIFLEGKYNKAAGTYYDTVSSTNGCDSIITTILTLKNPASSSINLQVCNGDSLLFNNKYIKTAGTYYDTLAGANTCDSIVTATVAFLNSLSVYQFKNICTNDSILVNGRYLKTEGMYYDTLQSNGGCDSIVTTEIIYILPKTATKTVTICANDSLEINNKYYKTTGIYTDTVYTGTCLDSIITLHLTVLPSQFSNSNIRLCQGDSLIIGNKTIKSSGNYTDSLKNSYGCDSIVTYNVAISPKPFSIITLSICPGDSAGYKGNYYTSDTVFYDTISNAPLCDSLITTRIKKVGVAPVISDTAFYCDTMVIVDAGNYPSVLWSDGSTGRYLSTNTEGIYSVFVTDTNSCFFTDTVVVAERCEPEIMIPNSFTPNDDKLNDYFVVHTNYVTGLRFIVFDRWGEILFETNKTSFSWDGNYKDKPLPIGIYHWFIAYEGIDKRGNLIRKNQKGMLTIIR